MKIITVTLDHLEQITPLFDAYRVFYGQNSDLGSAREFLRQRLLLRETMLFMALENETPLGFTQLFPSFTSVGMQRLWILNDLYVIETARGQRIGERLIERALEHAKESNATGVVLETAHTNVSGQKLYERMGFMREDLEYRTYFKAV
jgi:ribosomal protein S18 acetylase RimI-like enzyme